MAKPVASLVLPRGGAEQLEISGDTPNLTLENYDFESYSILPNCDESSICSGNTIIPSGTNRATIVFIAESLDISKPAGIWLIDDVILY